MTTATTTKRKQAASSNEAAEVDAAIALARSAEESVSFVPFMEQKRLVLTKEECRLKIANPTKSGAVPSDRELHMFMKICEFRGLNPYVGDVFLLGYDTKEGPKFETVVSHQALVKRAEANAAFDGIESGVIVWDRDSKEVRHVNGDVYPKTCELVGGWAKVFRKDRSRPAFKTTLLTAYQKPYGRWQTDAGWQIAKCAESKALRSSFPNDLGSMYTEEEFASIEKSDNFADETHNADVFVGGTFATSDSKQRTRIGDGLESRVEAAPDLFADQVEAEPLRADVDKCVEEIWSCTTDAQLEEVSSAWLEFYQDDDAMCQEVRQMRRQRLEEITTAAKS